jgi:hypothetical protein
MYVFLLSGRWAWVCFAEASDARLLQLSLWNSRVVDAIGMQGVLQKCQQHAYNSLNAAARSTSHHDYGWRWRQRTWHTLGWLTEQKMCSEIAAEARSHLAIIMSVAHAFRNSVDRGQGPRNGARHPRRVRCRHYCQDHNTQTLSVFSHLQAAQGRTH